jgi:hypothetical protein
MIDAHKKLHKALQDIEGMSIAISSLSTQIAEIRNIIRLHGDRLDSITTCVAQHNERDSVTKSTGRHKKSKTD